MRIGGIKQRGFAEKGRYGRRECLPCYAKILQEISLITTPMTGMVLGNSVRGNFARWSTIMTIMLTLRGRSIVRGHPSSIGFFVRVRARL